jgi:hypothetical protein
MARPRAESGQHGDGIMTTAEYKQYVRDWTQLEAMKPRPSELVSLLLHLRWLRLSAEAKLRTEFLPGMGRRRGDCSEDDDDDSTPIRSGVEV